MNCKPGDLAIIIQSEISENIGRIVHVGGPYGYAFDGVFRWVITAEGAPMRGCVANGQFVDANTGFIEDYMLRPVSGLPINDETPIEINVPEAVKLAWGIEAPVLS